MITDRQTWLLIFIIAVVALCLLIAFLKSMSKDRRRAREVKKREAVRQSLLNLDMASLTPNQEQQARRMAREAGLDFDDLDTEDEHWIKWQRRRDEQDRLDMLARVKAERVRQEELERAAIQSIIDEMPEPRHDL